MSLNFERIEQVDVVWADPSDRTTHVLGRSGPGNLKLNHIVHDSYSGNIMAVINPTARDTVHFRDIQTRGDLNYRLILKMVQQENPPNRQDYFQSLEFYQGLNAAKYGSRGVTH